MRRQLIHIFFGISLIFCFQKTKAQLSGVLTVPGTYTSIGAAINDLNLQGVNGAVTVNIAAGYAETSPFGGYLLTATGTSTSSITFQKNGVGPNPMITAYTGGTATPGSQKQDGVLSLLGSDYITLDGIDITDPNTTNPATMEYGIGLFITGPNNGCNYCTIKNCTIKLNRNNNTQGGYPAQDGSKGIEMINTLVTTHTNAITPNVTTGSNSYNKFYSNFIENCNIGICLAGSGTSNILYADRFNDVGGYSPSTGNTIINYGGATGATRPASAIRINGQWDFNASFNTVNNNNGSGINHTNKLEGVALTGTSYGTISIKSNTVTLKGGANNATVSAIESLNSLFTTTPTTVNIAQNLITGCAMTSTNFAAYFFAVYNTSSIQNLSITSNTFENCAFTGTNVSYYGMCNAGNPRSITFDSNFFNNLTFTNTAFTSTFNAIFNSSADPTSTISITSNTLQNSTTQGSGNYYFIKNVSNPLNIDINNNKISGINLFTLGSASIIDNSGGTAIINFKNNSIGSFTRTTLTNAVFGLINNAGPNSTVTISQNDVSNTVLTGTAGYIAIQNWGSYVSQSITSNTISNINNSGGYVSGLEAGGFSQGNINNNSINNITATGVIGLSVPGYSPGLSVHSNTINALKASQNTATGILMFTSKDCSIYKNRIFDLEGNGPTGGAIGISCNQIHSNLYIHNNLIADLRSPTAANGGVCGISLGQSTGTNTVNKVFYNTIYLNAVSTGSNFGSSAFTCRGDPNPNIGRLYLNNNIFVNTSTANGTGYTYAFERSAGVLDKNWDSTSNCNLFYAGNSPTKSIIYRSLFAYYSLNTMKSGMAPTEVNSVTELPVFQSTVGTSSNFLKVSTSVPTQIENAGFPVSVTDDHGGSLRNVSNPDIGSWEDNYIILDSVYPVITGITKTSGSCNFSTITFTANLIDAKGVASGSLAPRCYYKINSGPYTSIAGTLISGTNQNGVWSFTPTYTVLPYSTFHYYFVAQDINIPSNIGSMPYGCNASNVNTVTSPPPTTYSFTIYGILNGTYTVGTGGNFSTLTEAVKAYNLWCITGPVTYLLKDPSYSAAESFPITFSNNIDASYTNSLVIRPINSLNTAVTSTWNAGATFKFLDARYIAIDGINSGGASLTINNPYNGAVVWIASTNTITNAGCKKIGILNSNLIGGGGSSAGNLGITSTQDLSFATFGNGKDNDSCIIKNNIIENVFNGISAGGTTSLTVGANDGWVIDGNTIGPVFGGTNSVAGNGIKIGSACNFTISNNLIRNVITTSTNIAGMNLIGSMTGITVSQNTITNIASSAVTFSTNSICGIYLGFPVNNCVLEKNKVSSVYNNSSGSFGARGITIDGSLNVRLTNNMISDVYSVSNSTPPNWPIGLCIERGANNLDIDNNSIVLAGVRAGGTGTIASSALFINNLSTNLRLRNNIITNTYGSSPTSFTPELSYGIYCLSPASAFTAMDYNNYYVGGLSDSLILGYVGGSNRTSFGAFKAAFGNNLNSTNIAPVFASLSDLHLLPASNISLDNTGTPLSGVVDDIDNQTRHLTTPDVGADEFNTIPCSTISPGIQSVTNHSACYGPAFNLNSTGPTYASGINFQWQVSNTSGGPYSNVSSGSGANSVSYTTPVLSPGTYYYVLNSTCTVSASSAITNEATVTIYPLPTINISANPNPLCIGQTITITVTGANTYTWNPSIYSGTVAVFNASLSTNYTISGTDLNGCKNQSALTVTATTCVEINEKENNYLLSISPNPTSGELILKTNGEIFDIEIYNSAGQLILKQNTKESQTVFDLKEKADGIYFIKLIGNDDTIYYNKIIKN